VGRFTSVSVGDFNGDGKSDLVVAATGKNELNVFLGNGDGTFQTSLNYGVGIEPFSVAVGDFNGDGKADLAVANSGSSNVSILLGNGDGTFRTAVNYNAGALPLWVAIGDFNGDGKVDLATTDGDGADINVFLGNGDGTFRSPTSYAVGRYPNSIAVADFNGDGNADLAVTSLANNSVSVLLGKGDGTFQTAVNYLTGNGPYSLAAADLNGDGKIDLTTANNHGGPSVSVLLGNGDGTFLSAASYGAGSATSIVAGEFNGDGRADLAVANSGGALNGTLSIFLALPLRPDLSIAKAHTGSFTQGQSGAIYTVTVSNVGTLPTSGTVTVTDLLPTGLKIAAISGTGWNCVMSVLSCARTDALAPSATYPAITVTVNVAANAPATVTNAATVAGGGELNTSNDTANDATFVIAVAEAQTITFGALSDQTLGSGPLQIAATATSGLTVNFISNTSAVCTISGATVTLVAVGTCSITATQGGSATYAAAPPLTQTFSVKYSQTITFGALSNVLLVSQSFQISASASSGLLVSFASTTPGVCTVTGSTVTIVAAGTCSIVANQAGNASYAPAAPVTQSFIVIGPAIKQGGITPLYSSSNTIQPGSWISIFGSNLASTTATWNGEFPTSLAGTTVTINAKPAYLWYASPTQINLQAPDDTATGVVNVVLTNSSGTTTSTVTLAQVSPSFSLLADGAHVAGVIPTPDGTGAYGGGTYDLVGPVGVFPFNTRPVKQGETLTLFGVGFGPTNPAVPAGKVFSGVAPTINQVTISIGGVSANVAFAGITESGLYQFNVTVPNTGSGDKALQAAVVGVQTQAGPLVAVQ
jgi:uncharacterized protein (TIGR03437 family)